MSKALDDIFNTYAYSTQQKYQLKLADQKNLNLDYLKNPKYDWEQMREIRIALEYGIDPTAFCNPDIPSDAMQDIRITLFENAGIYEKEHELIKTKRLKRILLTAFMFILLIVGLGCLYINRDYIMLYYKDIYFELTDEKIDIGLSKIDSIDYTEYIEDYDKSDKIELPNEDIEDIGNYTVTYTISNQVKIKEVHLLVHVYDDTAPIINLSIHSVSISEDESIDPSNYIVSVTDNVDGDLLNNIVIDSNVQSTPGTYTITYSVNDNEGNTATDSIKVKVTETTTDNSTNSNATSESNSTSSSSNSTSAKTVTAKNKIFYFESIGDANDIYNKARAYAQNCVDNGTANGYEITPYKENDINIGYKVTFF